MAINFVQIQETSRNLFKAAKDRAVELKAQMEPRVERAAETAAKKVTEYTGRETSAAEIKKAAIVGAVGVGLVAVLAASGGVGVSPRMAADSVSEGFGGGDVMDQAGRFFAENGGSLNIETQYVDMDGCVLY